MSRLTDKQVRDGAAAEPAELADTEVWLESLDPQTTPGEVVPPEVRNVGRSVEALRQAEADLTAAVLAARQAGASWNALALPLGMSRQAVRQRFGPLEAQVNERGRIPTHVVDEYEARQPDSRQGRPVTAPGG